LPPAIHCDEGRSLSRIDKEVRPTLTWWDGAIVLSHIVGVGSLCAMESDSNDSIRRFTSGSDLIAATIPLNCSRSFLASVEVTLDFRVSGM